VRAKAPLLKHSKGFVGFCLFFLVDSTVCVTIYTSAEVFFCLFDAIFAVFFEKVSKIFGGLKYFYYLCAGFCVKMIILTSPSKDCVTKTYQI
jgi:hypothetical protein